MGPPRRKLQATVEETMNPPDALSEGQMIARVLKAQSNNLYTVELPSSDTLLVELEAKFRSTIWLKRGGYVLIDTKSLSDRENKLDGKIVNVVREEKLWRKEKYWPAGFEKQTRSWGDDEESTVGKMPPSDEEEDES